MIRYRNYSGRSGVAYYHIGEDLIKVRFTNSFKWYQWSYQGRAGKRNVDIMKVLARAGQGLNSFINQYVKYAYD